VWLIMLLATFFLVCGNIPLSTLSLLSSFIVRDHISYGNKPTGKIKVLCILIIMPLGNWNNQVEEDEMGGSCSTNGGEEERL
jgi:hypothetical protein